MKKISFLLKYLLLMVLVGISLVTYAQDSTEVATKILLIRHAEVEEDGTRNPPLSVKGIARSWKWTSFLQAEEVAMIFSTDLQRTQSTARTIADSQGIETIISYDPSTLDMASFLEQVKGKTVVVVGHSNTTPTFANGLIGIDQYRPIDHHDYGNLFIVTYWSAAQVSVVRLRID